MNVMNKTALNCCLLAALILPSWLCAQRGAQMGGSVHVQAPVTGTPALGIGNSVQWWIAFPSRTNRKILTSLGYQAYRGYEHGYTRYESAINPTNVGYRFQRIEVNKLSFLSLDLGFAIDKKETGSRWSYIISTRLAWLLASNGAQTDRVSGSSFRRWFSASPLNPFQGLQPSIPSGSQRLQRKEMLRGYDIGLHGSIRYRLTGDLHAELGAYQGLLNQWSRAYPGSNSLLVSSISIGLAAKIR